MAFIGNLLWFIFGGGIFSCILWFLGGLLLCVTVVGIPFGLAAFRIARFAAFPFGKELVDTRLVGGTRIIGTGLANFLWIILAGLWLAVAHVLAGIACFLSIIGIPFGLAHFKLAAVCFAPLGKQAVSKNVACAAQHRSAAQELDKRLSKNGK
jgi:uncharacterized membrane protein YccF (DUF307 family)